MAPQWSHVSAALSFGQVELQSALGAEGYTTQTTAAKQWQGERRVGNSVNKNCHICMKHLKRDGSVSHAQTYFYCSFCKIPLCREDR